MSTLVNMSAFDPLQYFSWWVFGGVVLAYTALVFHGEFSKEDGPLIFSKRNARTRRGVISLHLMFLTVLFVLMRIGIFLYPSLPRWMTKTFNSRGAAYSVLDMMYILAMIVMHYIERKRLYFESATHHHHDTGDSVRCSTTDKERKE